MYTQLYTKTVYSLLKSCLRIEEYVKRASEYHLKALAITDENNVYGIIKFYQACQEYNIKPLIGINVFLDGIIPLVLLAKNNEGYKNILRIASLVKLNDNKLTINDLSDYHQDLICIITTLPNIDLKSIFTSDLYLGIFPEITDNISLMNKRVIEYAHKHEIKIVALNEVRYLNESDALILSYIEAIDKGYTISPNEIKIYMNHQYLLEPQKFLTYFANYPTALENMEKISEQCNVTIEFNSVYLPKYQTENNVSSLSFLKALCKKGLEKRLNTKNIPAEYLERLKYELSVIEKMNFADYFLIVYDFVKYAKNKQIYVGPGRGSSAGSLVAYVLGITNIDPIEYQLLFERFLNPERISLPDIDLDFQDDRREEVIKYVQNKYGKYHVAHIIAFGTFQSRSAIRELGKAMGLKEFRINEIITYIDSNISIIENIQNNEQLQKVIYEYRDIRYLLDIAQKIENIPRNTTTHAAGIIICEKDLRDITALQPSIDDVYQTQFEALDLENLGLIKMDFLGIRNLSAINQIINLIKKNHNIEIDINKIPLDNQKTYRLIARGDTTGIFQLESKGMREVLQEINAQCFEDIVAVNALYRPGPMANIPHFIARKNNKEKITYLHNDLIPILRSTYGIIVYQEQIMMIVQKIAGYSLGEADLLRRAISKKQKEVIENERLKFVSKAINNGYDKDTSEILYDYIVRFGDYGFNRSHSVAYALISYQMAYLKANFLIEFMVVMLTNVIGSESQTNKYIRDSIRYGIKILPLSINESYNNYQIESNNSIRMSFLVIKGIGPSISQAIINERNKGKFKNLFDFMNRCKEIIKQNTFEALVFSGALDEFSYTKKTLIENYNKIIDFYRFNPSGYFSDKIEIENSCEYPVEELMKKEKVYLGFYLTSHPVQNYLKNSPDKYIT
ncbi:MAG TPA: DNA polymerase III subunit alpha, partial [Haloplasmataceae bacterium]